MKNASFSEFEKQKYVAVKPTGHNNYIWFETEKTTTELGCFIGEGGWGKGGAYTNLKCKVGEIDSFVYSENLQYT